MSKEWPVAHLKMVVEVRQLQDVVATHIAGGGMGLVGGVQAMYVRWG